MVVGPPRCGRFILTGSQNFSMMKAISQSLAGRIAICMLLPLSMSELGTKLKGLTLEEATKVRRGVDSF